MDIKKLLIGGIAGGILYFLLGWLIYGILLMEFMNNHTGIAGNISRAEPDFLYMTIGNLAMGFLLAYVFIKSGVNSLVSGFVTGAVVALLLSVGFDCMVYATTITLSKTAMAADVCAFTVMSAVVAALIAMVMNMGKKSA